MHACKCCYEEYLRSKGFASPTSCTRRVFSEKWRGAGEYSQIMAPWFLLNFITSPISFLPLILGKQKQFFYIAIAGAAIMILAFWVPDTFFHASIETTLWIVSLSQVAYNLFIIFKTFQYLREAKVA